LFHYKILRLGGRRQRSRSSDIEVPDLFAMESPVSAAARSLYAIILSNSEVPMSFRANRELLYEYIREVWQEGNPAAATKFISPEYKRHISPALPPLDPDGQIKRLTGFRAAFPDIEITVEEVIVDDDRLAFRSVMRGTHQGEFLGIAPTGKKVTVGLVDVIHFKDGQFQEQWGGPDVFDLLRQLGAKWVQS